MPPHCTRVRHKLWLGSQFHLTAVDVEVLSPDWGSTGIFPAQANNDFSRNRTFAGRSASRRMYQRYQAAP